MSKNTVELLKNKIQIRTWMIQLSKGLEAIHEAEVVHRDIKPENIFVGDSQRLNLKIGDLGISRVIDTGKEYQIGHQRTGIYGLSVQRPDDKDGFVYS